MASWERKVERVIGRLSYSAWYVMNHDAHGNRYKRHRPYRLPEEAQDLVEALGDHDRKRAEERAKAIMEGLRRRGVSID